VWPAGYTVIPITPFLSYVGPDRTVLSIDLIRKRRTPKLSVTRSLVRDGRLGRGLIFNKISEMAASESGEQQKKIKDEVALLEEIYKISPYSLRADPGFIIHGMKSMYHIEAAITTMVEWIEDNGDWL
jgi:hypothetical protein